MSWICKRCETENPDKMDVCEVCEAPAPRIINFTYDKILSENPITIRWIAESCDNIYIVYGGEQIDVTGKESFDIENPKETDVAFLLSNTDTTTRTQCFTMEFLDEPIIEFTVDRIKLRKNKDTTVVISWNLQNVLSSILKYRDKSIYIEENGEMEIEQSENTNYLLEVVALDEKTIFSKILTVEVFDECNIDFSADKYYVFPTIPVILSWNVANAKKVWLDSKEVGAVGSKVVEPSKAMTYTISAEDEFGIKEKTIEIGMLPIPQVKSLMAPIPNFVSNLSVTIQEPRLNVDLKFPTINIDWIKAEVPKVPSLKDLGLNVELSPPLPKLNLMSSIKTMFNHIIRK